MYEIYAHAQELDEPDAELGRFETLEAALSAADHFKQLYPSASLFIYHGDEVRASTLYVGSSVAWSAERPGA